MAKNTTYTLKQGHATSFRRTINPDAQKRKERKAPQEGDASYQLVLEPGTHYAFSDEELAGLQKEIDSGLLVPSDLDEHGRQRAVRADRAEKPGEDEGDEPKKSRASRKSGAQTRGRRKPKGVDVGAATGDTAKAEDAAE